MALEPLSLRAYAGRRKSLGLPGGTLPAVRKAILGGRLQGSVVTVAGVKKIADPELADREWLAHTDPTRGLAGFHEDEDEKPDSPMVLAAAKEKHWKALTAELAYRERAGEVVEAAGMQSAIEKDYALVRSRMLGLASRLKQRRPDVEVEVLAVLDELVREDLEALSSQQDGDDEAEAV